MDNEPWLAGPTAQSQRVRKEIQVWEPLPQPSDNTSTYSSHYQKWPLPRGNKAVKPKDERPMSATRFDTRSLFDPLTSTGDGNIE